MEKRMYKTIAIVYLFYASFISVEQLKATEASIILAKDSETNYKIVLAEDASGVQKFAAKELQSFLKQICRAELPIVTGSQPLGKCEIILGRNKHLKKLNTTINFSKLGKEGFIIRTAGNHIIITGGEAHGTLYGVYTFLEKYLGCRWYSSKVSRIPRHSTVSLPQIDDTQIPLLDYREVYYADAMDPNFAARLKLNGNASTMKNNKMILERHAGWGTWCHTSFSFVPPEEYFEEHPEYYSLINGKRQAKQLCFTNPDILGIVSRRMRELMAQPADFSPSVNRPIPRKGGPLWADAEDYYWDVSQMDGSGACQCPKCQAIDQREGSHIGSVLTFINKLAAEFPDKTISTLSYQYTRTPPKTLKPAPNVSIMLCNIECTRSFPIPESPYEADKNFASDLEKWSKICNNLFIWDYVVNFGHLYTPNPNLRIQQANIKYFIDHNVKGIFCQGSREVGGEFSELRNYLLAKLLWNPDCNVDKIINDFLSGYYGPAAPPIRRYIDLLHDSVKSSGKKLGIYDAPKAHLDGYLSPELLKQYKQCFIEAERLVANDKEVLFRVRTAHMPLMYVQLVNQVGPPLERLETLEQFTQLCEANNIQRLSEWGNSPEQFETAQKRAIHKEMALSINPAGGYLADFNSITIEINSEQPDVEIRYTLNGNKPGPQSTLYEKPFKLTGPAKVIANTFKQGKAGAKSTSAEFRQAVIPMESPIMYSSNNPFYIRLPVHNVQRLKLIVNDGGDGNGWDHGDWADAKLFDKNGKTTYLTDLMISHESQGWGQLGIDKSIAGNPIKMGDKTFKRGLGAHANSEIVYDIGGKYEYFETWIGVDAEANDEASIRFEVLTE